MNANNGDTQYQTLNNSNPSYQEVNLFSKKMTYCIYYGLLWLFIGGFILSIVWWIDTALSYITGVLLSILTLVFLLTLPMGYKFCLNSITREIQFKNITIINIYLFTNKTFKLDETASIAYFKDGQNVAFCVIPSDGSERIVICRQPRYMPSGGSVNFENSLCLDTVNRWIRRMKTF